jgi:AcrR family transcriptional regulator
MAKRDTRELILVTSQSLFNELGEPNVTTNHIADEADISPGNLYYHFRSKDDIVIDLFKRFLTRFLPLMEVPEDREVDAGDLWFLLHLSFELKGEFRFLYRNLSDLTSRIPDLNKAMRGVLMRERDAATRLLDDLERQGSLVLDEQEKAMLIDNLMLAVTYWIPYAEIFDRSSLEQGRAQVYSIARVLQLIVPYLNQPERSQYSSLIRSYLSEA